ncbi:MAG: hypothetical protein ACYTE5_12485 [Planctomycetota bacterium]|jgi:hypothetical protein
MRYSLATLAVLGIIVAAITVPGRKARKNLPKVLAISGAEKDPGNNRW